jgi:hypothetical protein
LKKNAPLPKAAEAAHFAIKGFHHAPNYEPEL